MSRERRKFKYDELEEHATAWAIRRLDELRDYAQDTTCDGGLLESEKEFILKAISMDIYKLLELLTPLTHDEPTLANWAQEFVDEYAVFEELSDD